MTISERITKARENLGITKRQLSHLLNVHETSISKYESGNVDFPISRIKELAKVLKVSEVWLLGLEDIKPSTTEISELIENLQHVLNTQDEVTFKGEPIGDYYKCFLNETLNAIISKIKQRQILVEILNNEKTDPSLIVKTENPEIVKSKAKEDVENIFKHSKELNQIKNFKFKNEDS